MFVRFKALAARIIRFNVTIMRPPPTLMRTAFFTLCLLCLQAFSHAQIQTVIEYGDSWKFNIPTQDPGTGWRAVGFNDTVPLNGVSWGSGPGLLGFESESVPSPGMQTAVGVTGGAPNTYLFRKTFTYSGSTTGMNFSIDQIVDDGVTYYLNGNLLGSVRHTPGAWDNFASGSVGNAAEEANILSGGLTGLINGTNVLCAEVHQVAALNSDLVFGARFKIIPYVPPTPGDTQYVIYISVDGLHAGYLKTFIETAPTQFPNFVRLRNASAYTYNARCDYAQSVTLPNHYSMITGRPVQQPAGLPSSVHHGFTENFPNPGDTVHTLGNPAVPYKYSVFDVVHDRGLSTALYADKIRLTTINSSYNEINGATDTVGPDNGKDKIDFAQILDYSPATLTSTLVSHINTSLENFTFVHFGIADQAGHASSWSNVPGSQYYNAVKTIDTHLGSILNAIEANSVIRNKVALILCTDHGGGGDSEVHNNHGNPEAVDNYTIPMFVMGPGFTPGSDLYSYFENRTNPGTVRLTFTDAAQPLHNGDAGNLATTLLGLPSIPGSFMIPEFKRNFHATRNSNSITMTWPSYLTGYSLEYTDNLPGGDASWTTVTTGITDVNGVKTYTHTFPPPNARFFRIRKPVAN